MSTRRKSKKKELPSPSSSSEDSEKVDVGKKPIWTSHVSKSGRKYYHNKRTGESRWTPPPDDRERDVNGKSMRNRKDSQKRISNFETTSVSRSAGISKRKLSDQRADEFCETNFDDSLRRPKKKRVRTCDQQEITNFSISSIQIPNFQSASSTISGQDIDAKNFSFKLTPPQETTPMDTSFSSMDHETSFAPPPVSTTFETEYVESMEVDDIVEGVNIFRRDVGSNFSDAVSLINESATDWGNSLTRRDAGNVVIVVDTNILLSDLSFVRNLENRSQNGSLRIVVPYVVLRELDFLKDERNLTSKRNQSGLCKNARSAIAWIHDQLMNGSSNNVIFQPSYANQEPFPGFKVACNDDRVLKCVMQINQQSEADNEDTLTILCTDDKNLLNKGRIDGLRCSNKKDLAMFLERLEQPPAEVVVPKYVASSVLGSNIYSTSAFSLPLDQSPLPVLTNDKPPIDKAKTSAKVLEIDSIMNSCRDLFVEIAEVEMKDALGDTWVEMVKVKRPWRTLADVLNIFVQHWMAVFHWVFKEKNAKVDLTKLHEEARHAIIFGSDQFGRPDTLQRLLRLVNDIGCSKNVDRVAVDRLSNGIQTILASLAS